MKKYLEAKGCSSRQKVIKMYDQRSKVLKAKLKFGVVPAILLVIPLIGNAILSTYLVGLSRLLGSQRIMEKARLCIGAINGMFLALVLTIWLGVNTSLEAALIFFVATFLMIYVIFRILMGFLLVDYIPESGCHQVCWLPIPLSPTLRSSIFEWCSTPRHRFP